MGKKERVVWRCGKCNKDFVRTGRRFRQMPPTPKTKGSFQYSEFVCPSCKQIMVRGDYPTE